MSLPATLYPSLGDSRELNELDRLPGGNSPRPPASFRQATVLPFERGLRVGMGLPYAASIRLLVERGAVRGARELLTLALREIPDDPELLRLHKVLSPPKVKKGSASDHDRNLEFRWLEEEGARHRDSWVALDGELLLAKAETLKELLARLETLAPSRPPLIHRIS